MTDMPYQDLLKYTGLTAYKVSRIPVVGPWISHIGRVTNILYQPPPASPLLWVEGAFTAAPRLIFLKTKPFLQAEEAYRFLNNRCGTKKRRGIVAKFSEAFKIADPAWSVKVPGGPLVQAGFEAAAEFALKAEWYFMVVDRVTEFAYNWTSLVYQWNLEAVPGEPHCIMGTGPGLEFEPVTGGVLAGWVAINEVKIFGDWYGIEVPAGVGASVSCSLEEAKDPNQDVPNPGFSYYIYEVNSGVQGPTMNSRDANGNPQMSQSTYFYDGGVTPHARWQVWLTPNPGPGWPQCQGSFQAFGGLYGKKGLNFDP